MNRMRNSKTLLPCALLLGALLAGSASAAPLGTAFNYQGRLEQNGQPAPNGIYQLVVALFAAETGGTPLVTNAVAAVPVTNGLFSASLDFGAGWFTGDERWLEVQVRTNDAGATYSLLSPRLRLAPTPNAIYASTAGSVASGAIGASQLGTIGVPSPGQVLGYNGSSLVWQSAGSGSGPWLLSGANTYFTGGNVGIGTANPGRLLQLGDAGIQGSQGMIRMASRSGVGAYTRTWEMGVPEGGNGDGDGRNYSFVIDDTALGTTPEFVLRYGSGRVGIGTLNPLARLHVNGPILSGLGHTFNGNNAVIGGGENNTTSADYATIGGGLNNQVTGAGSGTVGGGVGNTASGDAATVPGGYANIAQGRSSFAAGNAARALHDGSFVWADRQGTILSPTPYESTANNQFSVRASGGVRFETHFMQISGGGSEQAYLGGDGVGGDVQLGSGNPAVSNVALYNAATGAYMNLFARDVSTRVLTITGGADLAEPFPMKEEKIEKGSVVVIDPDHPGRLKRSTRAYDTRVAGIVSGANGIQPGISLKQEGALDQGENVALTGRVYVKADASFGAIAPGDLLTTSDTPGHAMKVTDHDQAQGAILGKAMTPLKDGTGLVLVLVTLQ